MGNLATPEALILRWNEVLSDPSLQDLPYKIEINAWGKIEMSPASNRHARLQGALAGEFTRQLPTGVTLTGCSILTKIGIRVPDVAWASADFMQAYGEITPYMRAPEICVEVLSPGNTAAEVREKKVLYFDAGAKEVWLCDQSGEVRFFGPKAVKPKPASRLCAEFPARIHLR